MIHKYKLNGYNIVLDVNSGAVHVVDELTYDLLDNVQPPFEDVCPEKVVKKLSRFYKKKTLKAVMKKLKNFINRNFSSQKIHTKNFQKLL